MKNKNFSFITLFILFLANGIQTRVFHTGNKEADTISYLNYYYFGSPNTGFCIVDYINRSINKFYSVAKKNKNKQALSSLFDEKTLYKRFKHIFESEFFTHPIKMASDMLIVLQDHFPYMQRKSRSLFCEILLDQVRCSISLCEKTIQKLKKLEKTLLMKNRESTVSLCYFYDLRCGLMRIKKAWKQFQKNVSHLHLNGPVELSHGEMITIAFFERLKAECPLNFIPNLLVHFIEKLCY